MRYQSFKGNTLLKKRRGLKSDEPWWTSHFLASSFFGSFSKGIVLSRKSLAARSCNVPPHFNPRSCSSDFNLSSPRTYNQFKKLKRTSVTVKTDDIKHPEYIYKDATSMGLKNWLEIYGSAFALILLPGTLFHQQRTG